MFSIVSPGQSSVGSGSELVSVSEILSSWEGATHLGWLLLQEWLLSQTDP